MPFFGWALLVDGGESVHVADGRLRDLRGAMVTDKIDGDIARSRGLITNFGKIADPIADKAITGMAFIGALDRGRHLVVGHHRGAGPRVERDPAPALDPQVGGDAGRRPRQAQDDRAGRGAGHPGAAPAARRRGPRRRVRPVRHGRRGGLLHRPGLPGGGGRADPVVGVRVLPRRLAPAGEHLDEIPAELSDLFRGSRVRVLRIPPLGKVPFVPLSSRPRRGHRTLAAGMGVALGATSLAVLAAAPAQAAPVQIQILATNDFHGRLLPRPARPPAPPCSPAR